MNKRILTLVIELDQDDRPAWIWDSHRENEYYCGVKVTVIAEGDITLKDWEWEEDEEKDV